MKRAFIMVLDSFGIGATEDAERFGDVRADTLGHIAEACAKGEADNGRKGPLNLPNLTRLGLAKAHEGSTGFIPAGMDGNAEVIGAYAWAHEMSSGKDTPSGHWEIAVSRFCLSGDISPITKTASRKSCWINWSNALICRVTSVTATFRYGHSGSAGRRAHENRQADFLYLR